MKLSLGISHNFRLNIGLKVEIGDLHQVAKGLHSDLLTHIFQNRHQSIHKYPKTN
jgi:hypothetical protein